MSATPDQPRDRWRVRIPDRHGAFGDAAVHVEVNLTTEQITMRLPDGTTTSIDATTARAVKDCLSAAIFTSLGAPGPWLRTERCDLTTDTWHHPASRPGRVSPPG